MEPGDRSHAPAHRFSRLRIVAPKTDFAATAHQQRLQPALIGSMPCRLLKELNQQIRHVLGCVHAFTQSTNAVKNSKYFASITLGY
jgi:hypothetical protein